MHWLRRFRLPSQLTGRDTRLGESAKAADLQGKRQNVPGNVQERPKTSCQMSANVVETSLRIR